MPASRRRSGRVSICEMGGTPVLRAVSLRATSRPTWANLAIVDRSEAYDFFVYCQN